MTLSIVLPLTLIKKKCSKDGDCKSNQKCIGGVCVDKIIPEGCSEDSECDSNQECVKGVCVDIMPEGCNPVCDTGYKCVDKICKPKNWKCTDTGGNYNCEQCDVGSGDFISEEECTSICKNGMKNWKCKYKNNYFSCEKNNDGLGDYTTDDECKSNCSVNNIPIRLHLYHGAFPNLEHAPVNGIKKHWQKIADFAKKNNFFCVYMNGDSSNINITPKVIAEMASYLSKNIILGVVITANPLTPPPISFIDKYSGTKDIRGGNNLPNLNPQFNKNKCSNEQVEIIPETNPKTFKDKYPAGIGGYNTGVPGEKLPDDPGCPNIIELMIKFYGDVNNEITILREHNTNIPYFTRFIQDTENNGTATARYGNWLQACIIYILPTLPNPCHDYDSGEDYFGNDRIKLFRFGKAGSNSTNAPDLLVEMTCAGSSEPNTCSEVKVENMIAYPEVYWFNDGLKEASCRGCSHDLAPLHRDAKKPDVCKSSTEDNGKPDIPGPCSSEICSTFLDYNFQNDYIIHSDTGDTSYFEQAKLAGCESCGHCLSCIPCGYNENGDINQKIPYIKFLKNPAGLAEYMLQDAGKSGIDALWKRPNTIPMFSNELAHNFTAEESGTVAFNANDLSISSKYGTPCLAREPYKDGNNIISGGDICGTFDGFGLWTWEYFYMFLQEFSKKTGIKDLGVYDAQFISNEWQTSGFSAPPYYTN